MEPIQKMVPENTQTKSLQDGTRLTAFAVTITTPNVDGAGTDANVYIEVAGHAYLMDKPDYNDFERGDTDTYSFRFPDFQFTLGQLRAARIRLYHDDRDRNPGWKCGQVTFQIEGAGDGAMWVYKVWPDIGWLATDEPPLFTREAVLQDGRPVA